MRCRKIKRIGFIKDKISDGCRGEMDIEIQLVDSMMDVDTR
jgi:hypothetical protein